MLQVVKVDWIKVLKTSFMLLFVAYPGVALKVLRMFRCREVDGVSWLAADMRLQCYTSEWFGYALYAFVVGVVYVIGLPAAVRALVHGVDEVALYVLKAFVRVV